LRHTRASDYSRLDRTVFTRTTVKPLTAAVAGAGALGNEAVKALGLLGTGCVLVIDPDVVQPSDLTRSVLFRQTDFTGCNKAVALASAAAKLFPDTQFLAEGSEIADVGFGRLAGVDLLLSCVDSDLARLEIAYISTRLGIPVCDAGLGTPNYSHGRVSWFPAASGACFGCKLTPRKRRELLTLWNATIRPCGDAPSEQAAPSTPTMAAMIGSAQVELGLRWKMQATSESQTFEISLDGEPRARWFRTPRSASCPFHEFPGDRLCELPSPQATFLDLLESAGESACVLLDWPIVVRARCRDCGREWAPMQRAAVLRRKQGIKSICPSCGSRSILEQESIRVIGRNSPWVGFKPEQLGLPESHRYAIRFESGGK